MPSSWFYHRNGVQNGPVDSAELRRLARSGQLLPTDLIWKQGMPQWVPASSGKGLFADHSGIQSGVPTPGDIPPFPVINTKSVASNREVSLSRDPSRFRLNALATIALWCLLASSYDYRYRPELMNVSLTLAYAAINSVLPLAIAFRVREQTTRALGLSRRTLLLLSAILVTGAFAVRIGTGYFVETFRLVTFAWETTGVALGVLLLMQLPRSVERVAIPVLALLYAGLQTYVVYGSINFLCTDFRRLLQHPMQMFRLVTSICYRGASAVAAVWCSIWRVFGRGATVSSAGDGTDLHAVAKRFVAIARGRAEQAGRLTQANAERTTLAKVSLPRAYAELGKAVYDDPAKRGHTPAPCELVAALISERQRLEAEMRSGPSPSTLAEKAKKAGAEAAAIARIKAQDRKIYQQFVRVGEAAYAARGMNAGPTEVVKRVAELLARRDELDTETNAIEAASTGQVITPRRIALGVGLSFGVALMLFVMPAAISVVAPGMSGGKDEHGSDSLQSVADDSQGQEPERRDGVDRSSGYYKNGYAQGLQLARGHKRLVAQDPSENYKIQQVRMSLRQELDSCHPSQTMLLELVSGKIDGFEKGMTDPTVK